MIEHLKSFLKDKDFKGFKKAFESATVNAHHRELLYELSYREQAEEFYEFMDKKTSLTEEKRVPIFVKTLADGNKIKDFKTVEILPDMPLAQELSKNMNMDNLMKSQEDEFLINFVKNKPISSFMNFKKMLFGGFKYEHVDFVDFISKQQLDKNTIFYSSLCAIHFGKRETFSTLLKNAMKYQPTILDDIKKMKDEYRLVMRGRGSIDKKEEFEAFINETLIETFAKHLNEELAEKKPLEASSTPRPRKMKI